MPRCDYSKTGQVRGWQHDSYSHQWPDLAVAEGSILQAARQAGIHIPTLAIGTTRSVGRVPGVPVEVEGARTLVACSRPHGRDVCPRQQCRARNAQAGGGVAARHDGIAGLRAHDDCELRRLASDMGIRTVTYEGAKARPKHDASTGLVRDNAKCIKPPLRHRVQRGAGWAHEPQGRGFIRSSARHLPAI